MGALDQGDPEPPCQFIGDLDLNHIYSCSLLWINVSAKVLIILSRVEFAMEFAMEFAV